MPTACTTFRFKPNDLAAFREFRAQLQAQFPGTPVTATDALRVAVSSATAALASGQPVALALEPGALPDRGNRPG